MNHERARMRDASHKHLMRHPEWLSGRSKLPDDELRDLVAMQHQLDFDLKDLSLPEADRCHKDTFTTSEISRQMLLDAPRSSFRVDGRRFSFPSVFADHGKPSKEEGVLKQCFLDSLVEAVHESLGRGAATPQILIRAVTTTMSQAGLANLDVACKMPQVVVSGGKHRVQFELQARADGAWDVLISVRKAGFGSFVVCGMAED